jgi:dTDP-4-amino-4,6-dideoxygalactose transaminase
MKSAIIGQWNRESFQRRVTKRILDVCSRGDFIEGEEVAQLEKKMARFVDRDFAIATSSGTDALVLALRALRARGKVAVPAFSFVASASAIVLAGCVPVFVDIRPDDFTIDVEQIPDEIKYVVAVDIFGVPANYPLLGDRADTTGMQVISDAAQSMGSQVSFAPCGHFGDVACTSFYPTKSLGAYGDAGMIFTDDALMAGRLRDLKNHGSIRKYEHFVIGYNARMATIQGAVLLEKLNESIFEKGIRQVVARRYMEELENVTFQKWSQNCIPNCSYFPVLFESEQERNRKFSGSRRCM